MGIYSSPGPKTCGGYAGSYGHEEQDANLYAEWGVDYLKYDLCSLRDILKRESGGDRQTYKQMEIAAYRKMHLALLATHRPIVYSLCQYGYDDVWQWEEQVGANLWRTTGDINDHADRMFLIGFSQAGLAPYAKPGHWNDPDMLEVGNGGMSNDEYRLHMSLWAVLAAPLLAGNDLTEMTPDTLAILTNRDVIAIDQDPMGVQGDRVSAVGPLEIWCKPLTGGAKALAFLNRGDSPSPVAFKLSTIGLHGSVTARNVWAGTTSPVANNELAVTIPPHGVVLLRLSGKMH